MDEIFQLNWQGKRVGEVGNLFNDMWYYQAQFLCKEMETFEVFCRLLKKTSPEYIFDHPSEESVVHLRKEGSEPIRFLVLKLEQDTIFMRILSS